jgi:hypothetical protein
MVEIEQDYASEDTMGLVHLFQGRHVVAGDRSDMSHGRSAGTIPSASLTRAYDTYVSVAASPGCRCPL